MGLNVGQNVNEISKEYANQADIVALASYEILVFATKKRELGESPGTNRCGGPSVRPVGSDQRGKGLWAPPGPQ